MNCISNLGTRRIIVVLLLSFCFLLTFKTDLSIIKDHHVWYNNFLCAIKGDGLTDLFALFGIFFLVIFCTYETGLRGVIKCVTSPSIIIPSVLFSSFQIWGKAFEEAGSWDMVIVSKTQLLKCSVVFFFLTLFFILVIQKLYNIFDKVSVGEKSGLLTEEWKNPVSLLFAKYLKCLLCRPLLTTFITLMILYTPYVIAYYPGIFNYDATAYIAEGFNQEAWTNRMLTLLDPDVKLTRWHSVTYIGFFHVCLLLGETVFHSDNVGVFIVSTSQLISSALIVSGIIKYLVIKKINVVLILLTIAYFGLNFRIFGYLFVDVKDIFYSYSLLGFSVLIVEYFILRSRPVSVRVIAVFCLVGLMIGTLRNEAVILFVVLFASLTMLNYRDRVAWKTVALCGAIIILSIMTYGRILTFFDVTSPSKGEMLSVPFQQTARYLKEYPDDITQDEYNSINSVLRIDEIADIYDPRRSDNVKNTFRTNSNTADLKGFFITWGKLFAKHPDVFFQATMNNYYDYFYISDSQNAEFFECKYSEQCMNTVNSYMDNHPLNIHYPSNKLVSKYRQGYEEINTMIYDIPIMSLLNKSAFYVWVLILWLSYVCRVRRFKWIPIIALYLMILAVLLLGPVGGYYFRYIYSIAIGLPIMIPITLLDQRNGNVCHN